MYKRNETYSKTLLYYDFCLAWLATLKHASAFEVSVHCIVGTARKYGANVKHCVTNIMNDNLQKHML